MNEVQKHYDSLIDEGNDPFRDPPTLRAYMDKWDGDVFLKAMELDGQKNVLEIGIGTGRLAARVAPRCRRLTGIDISPKTIDRARENLGHLSNICFLCGDFLTHSFEETYDVVYSSLTFLHFRDKAYVIHKVAELLNAGGRFVVSLDKHPATVLHFGSRSLPLFPDDPDIFCRLLEASALSVRSRLETDFAYILVAEKACGSVT